MDIFNVCVWKLVIRFGLVALLVPRAVGAKVLQLLLPGIHGKDTERFLVSCLGGNWFWGYYWRGPQHHCGAGHILV